MIIKVRSTTCSFEKLSAFVDTRLKLTLFRKDVFNLVLLLNLLAGAHDEPRVAGAECSYHSLLSYYGAGQR